MVRIRKKRNPPQNTTRAKGDILEEIVAEMHMVDGITVEKNVFLPTKNGNNRPREIDVLVTTVTSGLPIRIAIECKNENKKIGIEKIDAFIGKLQDVNIPPQLGIFVSSNGYTSGALIRAKDVGIKTLIFDGTESNLSETVIKAFQSTVYFLLKITNIQIRNNVPPGEIVSGGELLFFHDRKGAICGSVPDLVWQQWITGKIPMKLGDGVIQPKAPTNWKQTVQGKDVKIKELTISYKITGFGMTIPGVVTQHKLLDANDKTLHKGQITADFPLPAKRLLLTQLDTEEDLQSFENGHGQISITNRIQAPRIIWLAMYWPPSQSTLQKLNLLMTSAHKTGKVFDLNLLSLTSIEGDSLTKLWEPIIADHPMLKHMREKQNNKKK